MKIRLVAGVALLAVLLGSHAQASHARARVGIVPDGFEVKAVPDAAAAARYTRSYMETLGLKGLRVRRVAGTGDRFYVYVAEESTGRGAFTLEITPQGRLSLRGFPAMEPEMMWNQKYGHRARRDLATIRERLTPDQALARVAKAIPASTGLRIGSQEHYYGYLLVFLLDPRGRWVGEAAVNTVSGRVVWARFGGGPPSVLPPSADPGSGE